MHRREQRKSHRDFDQAAAPHDVGLAELRAGRNQFGFETEAARELRGPRLFGEERIGAGLHHEAVARDGSQRAAEMFAAFEDGHLDRHLARDRKFADAMRGGEAADSAADDRDARNFSLGVRRTAPVKLNAPDAVAQSAAIMSMNAGWSRRCPRAPSARHTRARSSQLRHRDRTAPRHGRREIRSASRLRGGSRACE